MSRRRTDAHWHYIQPLLPPPNQRGRPRADDRRTLDGVFHVLRTGMAWRDLPREPGSPITARRRLKRGQDNGTWERSWRTALNHLGASQGLDWTYAQLDGSFVPAKRGGRAVGLTREAKGTKWMLLTDALGASLGFHLDSAGLAETTLAPMTLATVAVTTRAGYVRGRPVCLVGDQGYDSGPFRRHLRQRGIRVCIPPKRRPKTWRPKRGRPLSDDRAAFAQPWKVERPFAWLGYFRRLLVRWEREVSVSEGFFVLALQVLRRVMPGKP